MMLMGDGVGGKYSVIIEGRKRELMKPKMTAEQREVAVEQLNEFRHDVQHGNRPNFEELYELYKG